MQIKPEDQTKVELITGGIVIAAIMVIMMALVTSCTPKRQDIPIYWEQTPAQAAIASYLHARDVGGNNYQVLPTGSMEPYLTGGDFIVVKPIPYKDIKVGMLANYQARWLPPSSLTVTHWVADKSGKEYIMDGQHNAHYERGPDFRMGEKEFRGIVIAIYTQRKKP